MSVDTTARRSRRALLGAGLGAVAATVAGAIGRPLPVVATPGNDHDQVVVGGAYPDARSSTYLANQATDDDVLVLGSNQDMGHGGGHALRAASESGDGVHATSYSGRGVFGHSVTATGVHGSSVSGSGVQGVSQSSRGVYGQSDTADAVYAYSGSGGRGVHGFGQTGEGVRGDSGGATVAGVVGHSYASATGVVGITGASEPAVPAKTGVFGYSGEAGGRRGQFAGQAAQIRLRPSSAMSHPLSGALGDLFLDKKKRLWFCKGGTTWKQLA